MRTDQLGTIVAVSDGSKVTFPEIKEGTGGDRTQNTAADQEYVINTNTKKFHLPDCKSAASMKEENRKTYKGSREELIQMGYEPCQSCNP
uniref:Ada metal-binding domain-containing protein n=1 Tax=Clostridium sp. NkU-1 TaxID=1095009 RepID=UPI000AA89575